MANDFWSSQTPIIIAHRGGDAAGKDQENTLKAFKAAQALGYRYGETDVILAASGEVVAIHGSRNLLQAGLKGDLSRFQLQKMELSQIRRNFKPFGIKISTLEEILIQLPNMRFLIDPKTDEVVLPLAKLIKNLGALDRVCVGSFDLDRVKQFAKVSAGAQISTSLIIGRSIRIVNKNLQMLKTGRLKDVEAIQLHHSLVSREMIDIVHKQGLKAIIWTCNSPLSIKNALNCGADGIISDRAELLKQLVQN
jgi:glycerophosphoryl diester phosphodiesterase